MRRSSFLVLVALLLLPAAKAQDVLRPADSQAGPKRSAKQVFASSGPLIFQDRFERDLRQWMLDIDENHHNDALATGRSPRVQMVLQGPQRTPAVRLTLPGGPGDFRAELSLPAEVGHQERWYAARTLVPAAPDAQGFILMQWHALVGEEHKTRASQTGLRNFPNMAIHVQNEQLVVARAWGPLLTPLREHRKLAPLLPGHWTDWIIHVQWSTADDGLVQIWQDGASVYLARGANLYDNISLVTPYFKTGIYRPTRKPKNGQDAAEAPTVVYLSTIAIGDASASLQSMQATLPASP